MNTNTATLAQTANSGATRTKQRFALLCVAANALVAVCCYQFVVGEIRRFELKSSS